jgi:hypothetical protein
LEASGGIILEDPLIRHDQRILCDLQFSKRLAVQQVLEPAKRRKKIPQMSTPVSFTTGATTNKKMDSSSALALPQKHC